MWYTQFLKTSLRKHNLRVDLRVYPGDELEPSSPQDLEQKLKSILSSAIIKGLDVIGIVSKYGIQAGQIAKQQSETNRIDLKVIPGQDYFSSDRVHAVFFGIQQDIQPGLPIQNAIVLCKKQRGKVMLYDLSKSQARAISNWQSTQYEPDLIEIYNAHSKAYKDLDIDYPRVICSAARSGSELEKIPVYSEIPRNKLQDYGFLSKDEGSDYTPGYLEDSQHG